MEGESQIKENAQPKKKKPPSQQFSSNSEDLFEVPMAGASREVGMLLSQYAQVLSERATVDTMLMKELQGILADARHLESYLKEKKQHLRQTLDLISEKLQN